MVAVDTNVLVYAHRPEPADHAAALAALDDLRHGTEPWAIPWTVAYEFLSVVTQPRIWVEPTPPAEALAALQAWTAPGQARLIGEAKGHLERLADLLPPSGVRGAGVFDARVAATCLDHGVRELWSADRDFGRFPALRVRNPLLGRG